MLLRKTHPANGMQNTRHETGIDEATKTLTDKPLGRCHRGSEL